MSPRERATSAWRASKVMKVMPASGIRRAAVDISGHSAPRSSAINCSMVIGDATRSIVRKGRRLGAGEIQPSAIQMPAEARWHNVCRGRVWRDEARSGPPVIGNRDVVAGLSPLHVGRKVGLQLANPYLLRNMLDHEATKCRKL